MFKSLIVLSLLVCTSAFAQDMSATEDFADAYTEDEAGGSVYIGKCSTHEDFEGKYFTERKVIQEYITPDSLTEAQIQSLFNKLGLDLIRAIFREANLEDFRSEGESDVEVFAQYIDDISVKTINYPLDPSLNLVSVSYGMGGGNGGYFIFNKVDGFTGVSYEMLSSTFDKDLQFCDKKVWLK